MSSQAMLMLLGHGPHFEWQGIARSCRGGLGRRPSLQTTVVWFGDCGVAGTMIWGQETRIQVITLPAPPHLWPMDKSLNFFEEWSCMAGGPPGVLMQGL